MKRLAWLLLIVVLSLNTLGFSTPPSPPAAVSATFANPPSLAGETPLQASIPGVNASCHHLRALRLCASVSEKVIVPGSFVTIYGSMKIRGEGVQGKLMRVLWHSRTSASCYGVTDENGLASCSTYFPARIARGHKVYVRVWLDGHKVTTHFRTKYLSRDPREDD
jgi:hypothetical protein